MCVAVCCRCWLDVRVVAGVCDGIVDVVVSVWLLVLVLLLVFWWMLFLLVCALLMMLLQRCCGC